MSGFFRIRAFLALSCASLLVAGGPAHADPFSCVPGSGLFAAGSRQTNLEDGKKLSRKEFQALPILPAEFVLLPKGTELNVVIDGACLKDPARGPLKLPWLGQLKQQVRLSEKDSSIRSYRWTLEQAWIFKNLQDALEEEPCVQLVSPEGHYYINEVFNDPYVRQQSHLSAIRFDRSMNDFMMPILVRRDVTIAIIDTGVDLNHPDLKSNRWINRGEIPGNGIDDDRNGYVDDVNGYNFSTDSPDTGPQGDWPENKHGTHVAGLAAARIDNSKGGVGVNGVAKILSLNVFGVNGYTRSSILENAIRYAADQKADVINLSLGGREYSRTMRTALEYAISRGSFIVTAAGNDGIELCDDPSSFDFISPAAYGSTIEGMIVTGSTDAASGKLSVFSNYSRRLVEITAPGAYTSDGQLLGLLSTLPNGAYGFLAGTSMSAPVLSGAASLVVAYLKTYGYSYTPAQLEKIFKDSARSGSGLSSSIQGGRVLDMGLLASYLKANYPTVHSP